MELAGVLRALAEHWDDVLGRLDEGDRAELIRLTAIATREPVQPEERTDAVLDIAVLLLPVLPLGHPLERAIGQTRSATTAVPAEHDLDPTLALLRSVVAPAGPAPETPWDGVRRRLLAADMLSELPGDPASVIRLEDDTGRPRFPAFQFDAQGRLLPVVQAVNTVLEADDDPWGAADWWLCPHAFLRAVPMDLLGRVPDVLLVDTAEREVAEDA